AHVARGLDHLPSERRGRWEQRLDACRTATPETFDRNGWVVHALQAALAVLAQTPVPTEGPTCRHLQLVIERAVRLGGDTDTVAAITGSLAGARWGATAVPHRWRRTLHGHPRRGEAAWRWGDLERTARLALDGGSTDSAGWPSVASMLPHYAEANPAAPRRVPLDDLVAVGNVHALPEVLAEVDAVVSLCRMGTRDVPSGIEHQVIGFHDTDPRDNPNLDFVLADTADLLGTLAAEGRRTFVHCVQAQHRTPAVGAAYLVRRHGLSPDEALDRVASRVGSRPQSFQVDAVRRLART
ncbi:MAG: ADP-ribosylglycohydrolase family protein, partial [Acidimicrobiales bacterium]|nr:ADP-ribosylglycohydrolase family protein [Acidimicrobiales bacterium]